jgi:energy-coupling factor transport system substrate-specific component
VASSAVHSRPWSTRDIVVTAALAVATGISFIVFDWVYLVGQSLVGGIAQSAMEGLWLLGALLVPYIIRRPGSALAGELIASLVESSFNPFGITVIVAGLLEGIGAEIVFLLTGYKRFDRKVMVIAGAFDALLFFVVWISWRQGYVAFGDGGLVLRQAPVVVLLYVVVETISGGVAGWLAKAIGDALVPTGVLDGFAIAAHRTRDV